MAFEHLGDTLGGLLGSIDDQRANNRKDADRQAEREKSIFESLANSDDPDIRAAAVTGLITGKSPGKFMDRFLQKQQEHPAFATIRNLVANGHQATLGATEQAKRTTEANTEGSYTGRVRGVMTGTKEAGFTQDETKDTVRGALGAARKAPTRQRVTIETSTGETFGGSYDPATGEYFDDDQNPVTDVKRSYTSPPGARTGAGAAPRTGPSGVGASNHYATMGQYRKMVASGMIGDMAGLDGVTDDTPVSFRIGSDGKEASRPALASPPPQAPNFSFIGTNEGIAAGNTHTGGISVPPGGRGLTPPTAPGTATSALREIVSTILRIHPAPKGLFGGLPSPVQQQAWKKAVDAEAAKFGAEYGYSTFDQLQAAVGGATNQTQQAVPPGAGGGAPGGNVPGGPPAAPGAPGSRPNPRQQGQRPAGSAGGGMPPAGGDAHDPAGILSFLPH